MLPEVAGAAWDDRTAAPEVAATLARLVQEGKLSSRVETIGVLIFKEQVLHLTREVELTDFRVRYNSTGFDPASKIAAQLKQMVGATPGANGGSKPRKQTTLLLVAAAVVLTGAGVILDSSDAIFAGVAALIALFAYLVSMGIASVFQRRVA